MQGLEGRSSNPVALLYDILSHPDADTGQDFPSLLNWRFHPEQAIDHVVLGRGPPGGSWQVVPHPHLPLFNHLISFFF